MHEYSTSREILYKNDLLSAKQCIKKYSTNYALATKLLDKDAQNDTIIAYAFFRFVDEIVDNPQPKVDVMSALSNIKNTWQECKSGKENISSDPDPIRAMFRLCSFKCVPFEYVDSFIDAMIQDTAKKRYATYQDLEDYMYGSATVVGYIMMYVFGYKDDKAFGYAKSYAESMQLINFLRDVNEDLVSRDRIYIPQEYLDKYGVTEDMLNLKVMNDNIRQLVIDLSTKSRELLDHGRKGIHLLNKRVWFPVFVAGNIYEYNLNLLEKRNYDIFQKPIRISKYQKIIIIFKSLIDLPKLTQIKKNN